MRRDEVSKQIAGFKQEWFGRMHRIDKFFHRVRPPPGAKMNTHKGVTPVPLLSAFLQTSIVQTLTQPQCAGTLML